MRPSMTRRQMKTSIPSPRKGSRHKLHRWMVRVYLKRPRQEPSWENVFTGPVVLSTALRKINNIVQFRYPSMYCGKPIALHNYDTGQSELIHPRKGSPWTLDRELVLAYTES